jgi:hypothetical protein
MRGGSRYQLVRRQPGRRHAMLIALLIALGVDLVWWRSRWL